MTNPPIKPTQLESVFAVVKDGDWYDLEDISLLLGSDDIRATVQSISARLRDLRKDRFGGFTVERRCAGKGVYRYRVIVPPSAVLPVAG